MKKADSEIWRNRHAPHLVFIVTGGDSTAGSTEERRCERCGAQECQQAVRGWYYGAYRYDYPGFYEWMKKHQNCPGPEAQIDAMNPEEVRTALEAEGIDPEKLTARLRERLAERLRA